MPNLVPFGLPWLFDAQRILFGLAGVLVLAIAIAVAVDDRPGAAASLAALRARQDTEVAVAIEFGAFGYEGLFGDACLFCGRPGR